jgi:hypothetical protein
MNEEKQLQAKAEKPYEKPALLRVSLRPEEAVLGHCKIASASGPAASSGSCVFPTPCPTPGS